MKTTQTEQIEDFYYSTTAPYNRVIFSNLKSQISAVHLGLAFKNNFLHFLSPKRQKEVLEEMARSADFPLPAYGQIRILDNKFKYINEAEQPFKFN